ncbi:MAG: glycosyltransferase family 39 protein [Anaerolineae bacterium]|nr:glycosyltransferase family 39 protein [Anaerolineae bacterium]
MRTAAAERRAVTLKASPAAMGLLALFVLGLFLRLAELDRIPLGETEARQALAAWDLLHPRQAVASLAAESPLMFAAQALLFSLFGASEVTARLPVALAGALLPLAPIVFRDALGWGRSLTLCLLLAVSPVLLMASRQSGPVILSLLLLAGALWGARRYRQTGEHAAAIGASVALLALLLLAEAGGPVLAVQVGLALLLTYWSRHRNRSPRANLATLRESLRRWPYATALPLALLIAFLVATLFMLHPAGLAAVGDLLQAALSGLVSPWSETSGIAGVDVWSASDQTAFAPRLGDFLARLQLVIAYEPLLVAATGGFLLLRHDNRPGDVDRFLLFWLLTGLLSLLLWRAASPAHALWLVLPLAGLAAGLLPEMQVTGETRLEWPAWLLALVAAVSFALLAAISFYVQLLLRNRAEQLSAFAGLALLPLMLLAGAWPRPWPPLLHAALSGAVLLVLFASLGGGWVTAVERAGDADGLWRRSATSQDVWLLRDTLRDLSGREGGGFSNLEIAALNDGASLPRWILRDQSELRLVDSLQDIFDAGVLLLPQAIEPPEGAGAWVGQDFAMSRYQDAGPGGGSARDFLGGGSRSGKGTRYVLWLRLNRFAGFAEDSEAQVTSS